MSRWYVIINWLTSRHFRAGYAHARSGRNLSGANPDILGWSAEQEWYLGWKAGRLDRA